MVRKLIFIFFLLFPSFVYCQENIDVKYNNGNFNFELNGEKWIYFKSVDEDKKTTDIYQTKNVFGTFIINDYYGRLRFHYGMDRKYSNYKNMISSSNLLDREYLLDLYGTLLKSTSEYEIVSYNIDFVKFQTIQDIDNIESHCETFITFNNGYELRMTFCPHPSIEYDVFYNDVNEVLSTVFIDGDVPIYTGRQFNVESWAYIEFVCLILIRYVLYFIFPFVKYILLKKEYTKEELNKTLILNSSIVFFINVIILSLFKFSFSIITPFFYYFINKFIYNQKLKKRDKSIRHEGFEDI